MVKGGGLMCAPHSANRGTTESAKATIPSDHEAATPVKSLLIEEPVIKIEDYDAKASLMKLPPSKPVFNSEEWVSQHFFSDQQNHEHRRTRSCTGKLEIFHLQRHDAQIEIVSSRSLQTGQSRERRNCSKGTTSRSGRNRRLYPAPPRDLSHTPDPESNDEEDNYDVNDDGIFETPKRNGSRGPGQSTPFTPASAYGPDDGFNPSDDMSPSRGRPRRPPPKSYPLFDLEAGRHLRGFNKTFLVEDPVGNAGKVPVAPSRSTERAPPPVTAETPSKEHDGVTTDEANTSEVETKAEKEESNFNSTTVKAENTMVHGIRFLDEFCRCDLLERFKACELWRCAASNAKPKKVPVQCKNLVSCRENEDLAIEYLERLQEPQDIAHCFKDLKGAIPLLFCSHPHRKFALNALSKWALVHRASLPIEELLNFLPHNTHKDRNSSSRKAAATSRPSTAATKESINPDAFRVRSQNVYDFRDTEARLLASARKKVLSMWIQKLQPYLPKTIQSLNTSECLRKAITAQLSRSRDLENGFLYMYWFSGNFGIRKIGVTTQDIEKRLRGWTTQCGHPVELVYPKKGIERVMIPHVFRLERIVFAELKDVRQKEDGCRCEKTHREWFKAKDFDILEVIDRWTRWIMQEPYEKIGDTWQLKAIHREKLDTLCIPLAASKQPSASSRGVTPNPTQSSRYK